MTIGLDDLVSEHVIDLDFKPDLRECRFPAA
jgi:hypothetical protein